MDYKKIIAIKKEEAAPRMGVMRPHGYEDGAKILLGNEWALLWGGSYTRL